MGRKSKYTPEIGDKIIELMASGASLRDIAAMAGMPPRQTMSAWGTSGEVSDPDFPGRYARARAEGAHVQFDELKELEDRLLDKDDDLDPHAARVAIDTKKWRLSKMLPGVYGERSHVEHSGSIQTTPKDHAPEWMLDRLASKTEQPGTANETRH